MKVPLYTNNYIKITKIRSNANLCFLSQRHEILYPVWFQPAGKNKRAIVKLGKNYPTYLYELAKTMLEPKFRVPNSKNKSLWIMVPSLYLIIPLQYFESSSQAKNDLLIFIGSLKQHWTQNFMSLTKKTKICNIMAHSFYLIFVIFIQ